MSAVATTKMSSKGQVVIPENIREHLSLEPGSQFVVLGEGDSVILKVLTPPNSKDFKSLIKNAQKEAKKAHLSREDIDKAVKKARRTQ